MFLPVAIWVLTMLDCTLTQTLASSITTQSFIAVACVALVSSGHSYGFVLGNSVKGYSSFAKCNARVRMD